MAFFSYPPYAANSPTFPGNVTISGALTMGNTLLAVSGSAGAPGIAFVSFGTTGIYQLSTGLGFSTGGVSRLLINSSGNATFSFNIATARFDVASAATITALDSTRSFVRLTGATATALAGISAGSDGQRLTLVNTTGANLTVQHENAGATAANRITTMTGADIATTTNGTAEFIYDTGSSRWICLYVTP